MNSTGNVDDVLSKYGGATNRLLVYLRAWPVLSLLNVSIPGTLLCMPSPLSPCRSTGPEAWYVDVCFHFIYCVGHSLLLYNIVAANAHGAGDPAQPAILTRATNDSNPQPEPRRSRSPAGPLRLAAVMTLGEDIYAFGFRLLPSIS